MSLVICVPARWSAICLCFTFVDFDPPNYQPDPYVYICMPHRQEAMRRLLEGGHHERKEETE